MVRIMARSSRSRYGRDAKPSDQKSCTGNDTGTRQNRNTPCHSHHSPKPCKCPTLDVQSPLKLSPGPTKLPHHQTRTAKNVQKKLNQCDIDLGSICCVTSYNLLPPALRRSPGSAHQNAACGAQPAQGCPERGGGGEPLYRQQKRKLMGMLTASWSRHGPHDQGNSIEQQLMVDGG